LQDVRRLLPQYDYIYFGDNARAPYGNRSLEMIRRFTHQSVQYLLDYGCPLVILGCNTASAKALRWLQQQVINKQGLSERVLGVIVPTVQVIGGYTRNRVVGILGTQGTVDSHTYDAEIHKYVPDVAIYSQACPMLAPLVENHELDNEGTDYFVRKYVGQLLAQDPRIDAILLACTHYPLLLSSFRKYVPAGTQLVTQGPIVADSLKDYLQRHPEMERRLTREGTCHYLTTESPENFLRGARVFVDESLTVEHIELAQK